MKLFKDYVEKDLENKNFAILLCDAEEPYDLIVSLHEEYDKAKKRHTYLKNQAIKDFDKGISNCDYILVPVDDKRVKRSWNYEREED